MELTQSALPQLPNEGSNTINYRMYSDNKLIKVVKKRPLSRYNADSAQNLQLPDIRFSPAHKIAQKHKSFDTSSLKKLSSTTDNPKAILHRYFKSIIIKQARSLSQIKPIVAEKTDKKKIKENLDKSKNRISMKYKKSKSYFRRKDEIMKDYKKEQEIIKIKFIDHKKSRPNYRPREFKLRNEQTQLGKSTSQVKNLSFLTNKTFSGKKVRSSFDNSQAINQSYSLDNLKNLCDTAHSGITNLKKRLDDVYPEHLKQVAAPHVSSRCFNDIPHRNDKKEQILARLKFELLRDFDMNKYRI